MALAPKPNFVVVELEVTGKSFSTGAPFSFKVEYYQPKDYAAWCEWTDETTRNTLLNERLRIRGGDRFRALRAGGKNRLPMSESDIRDYAAKYHPAVKAHVTVAPRPMTPQEMREYLLALSPEDRTKFLEGIE